MNAVSLNYVPSQPIAPAATLRHLLRGVRQYLPTISAGHDRQNLALGFERMATLRSLDGDERGAAHLEAHAMALWDSGSVN